MAVKVGIVTITPQKPGWPQGSPFPAIEGLERNGQEAEVAVRS